MPENAFLFLRHFGFKSTLSYVKNVLKESRHGQTMGIMKKHPHIHAVR